MLTPLPLRIRSGDGRGSRSILAGGLGHPPRETFPTPHPAFLCLPHLGITKILQGLWTCEGCWFGQSMDALSWLRSNQGWGRCLPGLSPVTLPGAGSLCPIPHHAQTHIFYAPPSSLRNLTTEAVKPPLSMAVHLVLGTART